MSSSVLLQKVKTHKTMLFLIGVGVVFLATRLFLLTSVPRGLNVDEAGMAYDALCLSEYGTDRYGTWHPVYLTNHGSGQSALYAYIASFCIKILGFRPLAFRLPAVFGGFLVLFFGYLIARDTIGKKGSLLIAALITLCPYFVMSSRWGLDCNLLLGFSTMSVYWLMYAVKKGNLWSFALAGVSFGITLYTYAVSYVVLPVFLFLSFLYLSWNKKLKGKQAVAFALPLGLLALPLLLFIAVNNQLLEPIYTPFFTIHRLDYYRSGEFSLDNIIPNLHIYKELLTTDFLPYNSFAEFGTLYYISVPFLFLGMGLSLVRTVKSVVARTYDSQTYITVIFLILLVLSSVMMLPNINKSNAIYFPAVYFVVLAFDFILKKFGKWGNLLFAGILGAYSLCFLFFGNYYYFHYAEEVYPQRYFNDSLIPMLDLIETEYSNGTTRHIYVDTYDDNVSQPYIYSLIRKPITPEEFQEKRGRENSYDHYYFYMPEELDMDGIYIMYSNEEMIEKLRQAGFSERKYSLWTIYCR